MEKAVYRIKEIAEVVGGGTPRTDNDAFWNGDIPWISPNDLTNYKYVYIGHGANFITDLGYRKSSTKMLPQGTILFSSRAPIGYVAIAANKICTNQGFKSLVLKETINNVYFYYWIKCNLDYIKCYGSGATFPELSGSRMKNIKVEIFNDIIYQKKIANVLSKYDDLIENNDKRIRLLEQMAESLYKEWFVRFRFPGHEIVKFVDGIPEGWKYEKFSDVCPYTRGISYSSEQIENENSTNLLINLKNLRDYGGFRKENCKHYEGLYKTEQMVKKFDLVMAVTEMVQDRRIIGYVGLVPSYEKKCVISADLIKFNSDISNIFLYAMFTYGDVSRYCSQYGNGTNVIHLRPTSLRNIKLLIPEHSLIEKYSSIVEQYFEEIDRLQQANENLIKQRDALLPKLMSGKIDLSNKEII